jgi:hypothetical protein
MLVDLDELVLKCRDERARAYISEAVACCKAGAYRSAIVSTWIAVAFDIIDKLRELSLAGDKAAQELVDDFDQITGTNNLVRALAFERELLSVALNKFELISHQEYVDLERLQSDRHRCAHPSLISSNEVFSPPAELARLHVRSAVEYLLQHEPAQGKAALAALVKEITSQYFPVTEHEALAVLDKSPLRRARPSLVRNLLIVLLKALLDPTKEGFESVRCRRATMCIQKMHPALFSQVLEDEFPKLFRNLRNDEQLVHGIRLLSIGNVFVESLGEDQIILLQQFARRLPAEQIDILEELLDIKPLAEAAQSRVNRLSAKELEAHVFFGLPKQVRERVVSAYTTVNSNDSANEWGKIIDNNSTDFAADEIRSILTGAAKNDQIRQSFTLPRVIDSLRKRKRVPDEEFEALAQEALPPKESDDFDDDIPF